LLGDGIMSETVRAQPPIRQADLAGRSSRLPPFVWLTTATMLALLILGTVILPQLIIPDEKHHADMVLMVQEGDWIEEGWPGIGDRLVDQEIIDASLSLGPREAALRENRAAQHPPLSYVGAALISGVATLAVDNPDLVLQLWSYRILSVLVAAALPITYYLIAAELTTNRWVRLASAVVPLAIPGITLRSGAMINTDALLIFLTSVAVLFAIRVAKGDATLRTSVYLGLSTGLATLTKGHALMVIPVVLVAYGISVVRDRRITRQWLISAATSGGVALITGGWWWLRNLSLYGSVQPLRQPVTDPPDVVWIDWLTEAVYRMVATFWGAHHALGGKAWMWLFWTLTILFVVGWIVGWVKSKDRTASTVSSLYALLLGPAILLTSALLTMQRGRVAGAQGRYLFPVLAGTAPLAVIALAAATRRMSRWLPALLVSGALAMTVLAIQYMFNTYWNPLGWGWHERWSAVVSASPFPNAVVVGMSALAVAAFLSLAVMAVVIGLRADTGLTGISRRESR
jgi:4-amino-4-deoxy-L-arabinose transferase-like glycosyltransferase